MQSEEAAKLFYHSSPPPHSHSPFWEWRLEASVPESKWRQDVTNHIIFTQGVWAMLERFFYGRSSLWTFSQHDFLFLDALRTSTTVRNFSYKLYVYCTRHCAWFLQSVPRYLVLFKILQLLLISGRVSWNHDKYTKGRLSSIHLQVLQLFVWNWWSQGGGMFLHILTGPKILKTFKWTQNVKFQCLRASHSELTTFNVLRWDNSNCSMYDK